MARIVKKHGRRALILGVIFLLFISYFSIYQVRAGTLTDRSDVLSDSRPNNYANHTIEFTLDATTDWNPTKTLTLTFESDFDLSDLANNDPTDYDINTGSDETIVAAGNCGANDAIEITSIVGQVITFTACANYTAPGSGSTITIKIGTHTSVDGVGDSQIRNPTVGGTYDVDVGGTIGDSGKIQVAIVPGVTVSATVNENLTFSISGVTNTNCSASFSSLSGPDTSATAVSFGSLAAVNTFYHGCQDLTISTNAENGYAINVQELTNLRTSSGTNIADTTGDNGTMTESVSDTWATAVGNAGFGISCVNLTGTDCKFTYTNYRQIACIGSDDECDPGTGNETPQIIMSNSTGVDANSSRIEYKLSIVGDQPAGVYSNTVIYIATPTY